jgi:hypothetical protein
MVDAFVKANKLIVASPGEELEGGAQGDCRRPEALG